MKERRGKRKPDCKIDVNIIEAIAADAWKNRERTREISSIRKVELSRCDGIRLHRGLIACCAALPASSCFTHRRTATAGQDDELKDTGVDSEIAVQALVEDPEQVEDLSRTTLDVALGALRHGLWFCYRILKYVL